MLERIRGLLGRPTELGCKNPTRNAQCTEFEVDNWVLSSFVLERLVPIVGIHPFPLNELMLMTAAVCRLQPSQIFEWGTHIGKSARIFYEATKHFRVDCTIHSIDLPDQITHPEHPRDQRGLMVRGLPRVILHQGDGLDTALSIWEREHRQARPLFLVDGDHAYESVLRELRGIAQHIPDANVLLHDTFHQSAESGYNVGPCEAIRAVLDECMRGSHRRIDSGLGLPGMTLLFRL